ncbi:MAG: AIPR family protein [Lysobacteraceae bacterium]|jgi:hypothetical protein|nr:AIPR family protein [Silanimonas sp.]
MSKLHVTQIGGYLRSTLGGIIPMDDVAKHSDTAHVDKVFLTRALTALAISHLADVKAEDLSSSITDGTDDGGIDGIYFDPNERTLYLVQTKWHEDGNGSIELGDTLKFINGVSSVLNNELSSFNARIKARQSDIQSALYDASSKFVLVIAHTGQQALAGPVSEALQRYVDSQNDTSELMKLAVLGQGEVHKAVSAGVAGAPIALEVQLTGWGQIRDPHIAFYGQVCATDIAAWMTAHGNRLFATNLRQFLGGNTVNDDIVKTLKTKPEDFWYLNNGITAIASQVGKKPIGGNHSDSGIFECSGFNVVNGAQTVGSIHAANAVAPDQVAKAKVSVRIISTAKNPTEFGTEVTRCTNTQNAIAKRDFVALDPEQERIRQELHFDGVEYAYKSGATPGPSPARFDLTEAVLARACAFPTVEMAVQAKREISKLWEDISKAPYKVLFNPSVTGPALWSLVQKRRHIESAMQLLSMEYSGRDALICVHGNRFIEWASMQALDGCPAKTIEEVVGETIAKVVAAVKANYGDSYPASLFKNLTKCKVLAAAI